jgi:hypothetical protein
MVNKNQSKGGRAIKINFEEAKATAFGGLALVERLAMRLGLWSRLEKALPKRGILRAGVIGASVVARGGFAGRVWFQAREQETKGWTGTEAPDARLRRVVATTPFAVHASGARGQPCADHPGHFSGSAARPSESLAHILV